MDIIDKHKRITIGKSCRKTRHADKMNFLPVIRAKKPPERISSFPNIEHRNPHYYIKDGSLARCLTRIERKKIKKGKTNAPKNPITAM